MINKKYLILGMFTAFGTLVMNVNAQKIENVSQNITNIYEIAINNKTNEVYAASAGKRGENNAYIYILDGATLTVKDSIKTESSPFGLAFNNSTQILYASNTRSNSITVFDMQEKKELKKLSHGKDKSHTREIVIDEINNKVYVSDVGNPSEIWVIDGNTQEYLHSIENIGAQATGIILDAKSENIYATLMGEGRVIGININSKKRFLDVLIDTSASPINVVIDEEKKLLYASDSRKNQVHVIDILNNRLAKSIIVEGSPIGIELDLKNNKIYTANREGKSLSVIDRDKLEVIMHIPTEGLSNTIKTNLNTGKSYFSNKQVSTMNRKDEPTNAIPLKNGDAVGVLVY